MGADNNLKTLLITYDLQPPWDSGLKVYGRGLMHSMKLVQGLDVIDTATASETDTASSDISNLNGMNHDESYYDFVHVVLTGSKPLENALKRFKHATIFKHIVTPSMGLKNKFTTKMYYGLRNGLEGERLVRCFSSEFVAHSYSMDGSNNIIPPSVDTSAFRNNDQESRENDILSSLETSNVKSGLENLGKYSDNLKLLYSGPLTEDRFPYRSVLDAVKQTKSNILVIGRPTNQGAGTEKIQEIVSYAQRIGIENRVSAALKLLSEDEKIRLINYSDIVIQPFAKNTQLYVAVDPPIFLLEAMACGRPVITSKSYSFQSLIENGYNGYTIDWDNPKELNRVLNDCQRITTRTLGNNARQTVLQDFSYSSVSQKLRVMYNDYN